MSADQLNQPTVLDLQQFLIALTATLQQNNASNSASNSTHTPTETIYDRKVRLRDPDVFTGEICDQQVVDAWLRSIERYQEFCKWDSEKTVTFAVTYLRDYADTWFRSLEEVNDAPTTWDDFKDVFNQRFRPDNAYDLARDKLVELRQTSTIKDYVQQFTSTIIMIPEIHHLECYDKFMRGLKPVHDQLFAELRAVKVADRSMELAYTKALSFEASHVRRDSNGKVISAPAMPAPPVQRRYDAMDLDLMQQQYRSNNSPSSSYRGGRGRGRGRGRGGGSYSSYNKPSGTNQNNNNYNQNSSIYCKICKRHGHTLTTCSLLESVISLVERGRNSSGSSINVLHHETATDQEDPSSNGSILNKNHFSDNYSHTSSLSSCDNNRNPSKCTTGPIVKKDIIHKQSSTPTSSPLPPISADVIKISATPTPQELVPVINSSCPMAELNHIVQLNSVTGSLPLYNAVIGPNNTVIKVLIDSGASDNYVSAKLANSIASMITMVDGDSREVEVANGESTVVNKEAYMELNIGGYVCDVRAFVFPTKFDLILGRSWLQEHEPTPNWSNDTWRLGSENDAILLSPIETMVNDFTSCAGTDYAQGLPQLNYLISSKQLSKHFKEEGTTGCLLYMKESSSNPSFPSKDGHSKNETWVQQLLKEFSSVFSDALPGLPTDSGFEHVIQLQPDAKPINRAPYKMSPAELDELRKQLDELLALGLIRPSSSPFGSPVLFVRKRDGSMRMCIDYRALNALTIKNSSPLPRIDECFDRLQGASYFSCLDLKAGYHQIRIQESDVPKTSFNTRYGKYEWLVLPFGLCNAPPSFQAKMNEVLGDYIDKFCLVYLDDICIFSKNLEDHKTHVRLILERLKKNNLIANAKKCTFAQRELTFLGFQINAQGILPSPLQVKAVREWTRPTNVQEVRQFIGLAQHYRRFIPLFASIAAPITDLTKGTGTKRRPVTWTPECEKAFIQIKQLLTSSPVLLMPDMNKPYRIETDSSDYGIGAVLLQPADESTDLKSTTTTTWHPVAYESKKLSSAERNYPAQERELLGIIHALRTWECFIDGCPRGYQVFTDHFSLQYLRNSTKPTPRLVRWLSELESYSPEIIYKSGKTNIVPDLLSRVDGPDCTPAVDSFEPKYAYSIDSSYDVSYLLAADLKSSNDPVDKELSLELQQDWPLLYRHNLDQMVKTQKLKTLLEREKDNFVIKADQSVYRKVNIKVDQGQNSDNSKNTTTVVKEVPFVAFSKRADLIEDYHLSFGHAGVKLMISMLEPRYWWPTMRRDTEFWIKTCSSCQVNKAQPTKHQHEMLPLNVPEAFSRWHLDFIGELPVSKKGNRWIITAVDSLTNWPIARSVPYASASAVADFLYEEIVMRFGCPAEIITDRGSAFTSNLIKSYVHRMGANHKLTSAFHPRTNSKVERFNGIIKPILRKYVNGAIHRWDDFLETALWACRIRKHTTTGNSPFKLTYGRDPVLPGDALRPYIDAETAKDPRTIADYTSRELEALGQLRAAAKFRVEAVNDRDKEKWDAAIKPVLFEPGDLVMLTNEGRYGLEPLYKGPYVILQYFPEYGTYKLETVQGKPLDSLIHADRLQKAHGDKPEEPWYEPSSFLRRPVAISDNDDLTENDAHHIPVSARPMNQPITKNRNSHTTSVHAGGAGGGSYYPPSSKNSRPSTAVNNDDPGNITNYTADPVISEDISVDHSEVEQDCVGEEFENTHFDEEILDDRSDLTIDQHSKQNSEIDDNRVETEAFEEVELVEDVINIEDLEDSEVLKEVEKDEKDENSQNEENIQKFSANDIVDEPRFTEDFDDDMSEYEDALDSTEDNESIAKIDLQSDSDENMIHSSPALSTKSDNPNQGEIDSSALKSKTIENIVSNPLSAPNSTSAHTKELQNNIFNKPKFIGPLLPFSLPTNNNQQLHAPHQIAQQGITPSLTLSMPPNNLVFWENNSPLPANLSLPSLAAPPPTPRLRPVVTDCSTQSHPTSITSSPPPESDFTFDCPMPSVSPPSSTASPPLPAPTDIPSGVPGVTPILEGDNVELAVDDSDEEIPDFIKSWNIHKTKRFRPTVPRRDKQTKRQRTVAPVRCPPRNTRTQYKYIDRYDK